MKKTFKLNPRYLTAIFLIGILVPIIYLTSLDGIAFRVVGFIVFFLIGLLLLFEFTKNLNLTLWHYFLPLAALLFIFFYNWNLLKDIFNSGADFSTLLNLVSWEELLLPILLFLPIFLFDKKGTLKNYLLLSIFSILIPLFVKALFIINIIDVVLVIFLISITIISDTFSYFGGMFWGKHKMIPTISPKKTWEGFIVGLVFAIVIAFFIGYFTKVFASLNHEILILAFLVLILPFISPIGDLLFSAIKRELGIKDFSELLPGHGGMLDRLDSLVAVVLFFLLIVKVVN